MPERFLYKRMIVDHEKHYRSRTPFSSPFRRLAGIGLS
jgi:hypothetical protein